MCNLNYKSLKAKKYLLTQHTSGFKNVDNIFL